MTVHSKRALLGVEPAISEWAKRVGDVRTSDLTAQAASSLVLNATTDPAPGSHPPLARRVQGRRSSWAECEDDCSLQSSAES